MEFNKDTVAKLCEIAAIEGALRQAGKIGSFVDLYDAYEHYEAIYMDWAAGNGIKSEEEKTYITAYANRVLLERYSVQLARDGICTIPAQRERNTIDNVLVVRYDKEINQHVDVLAKHFIAKNAGLEQSEMFEDIDNGVAFIYDEEVGGEIEMTFGEDEVSAFVKITSDHVYDVITINEIVESVINRVES